MSEADGSKAMLQERENDLETDMSCSMSLPLPILPKCTLKVFKCICQKCLSQKCICSINKLENVFLKEGFGNRHELQPASLPWDTNVHYFDLGST